MREVAEILFGAAFTVAVSIALGSLLLTRLRLTFHRWEATLFEFIAGAGCLSFLTALLCTLQIARKGVFLWGGLATIAIAIWRGWHALRRRSLPSVPLTWMAAFFLIFGAFFIYYFFNALAPEISPDGSGYHLGNVVRIWHNHGFDWNYHSLYSYFSQGSEMLFLVAFCFGRHPAAALVHFTWLCALPMLMVCWGRRFGFAKPSIFAALLVFASPVVGKDGISAYNDLMVATLIYAVFYLLQVWDEIPSFNLLILIGLLSGSVYAIKYTAFLTLPFAAGWVLYSAFRSKESGAKSSLWLSVGKQRVLPALVFLTLPALIMVAPWVLRNWLWVGNPVAPFLNSLFPNPYYHPGMERIYADTLSHYNGIKHYWEIPLQLTLRSGFDGGTFSPVFLLAPLGLLTLRLRFGRRLLLAALVFALPAYLNTGTRFLIPSSPFLALALGIGLADVPLALPILGLFSALVCWPPVLSTYCDSWNWRISSFPGRVALRLDPVEPFVLKNLPDYALKVPVELAVPKGERIFSFAGRPQAYIDRDIIVSYESTLGNLANDILWTPQAHKPSHSEHFHFLPVTTRAVRVVNIASAPDFWTVSEMRLRLQGRELPRSAEWRISGSPNGWEAPLAFDNSYATRWSTWEAMAPHAHLQVDFPAPQRIDEIVLECEPAWKARVQVEILLDTGRWVALTDTPEFVKTDFPPGIRRAATREMKALGLRFLLVNEGDLVYADMKKYPSFWGITQLAEVNATHFYRID
jgi:hypothetical protein